MTVLIDPPRWPAHGRLWSHLVSDTSLHELHELARRAGVPRRAFSGDHYDVPQERYDDLVGVGAVAVEARELLARLVASGLRVPKRRGERLLDSRRVLDWLPHSGSGTLDLMDSPLEVDPAAVVVTRGIGLDPQGRLLVVAGDAGPALPVVAEPTASPRVGFHRLRLSEPGPGWSGPCPWAFVSYVATSAAGGEPQDPDEPAPARMDAWPLVQRVLDARPPRGRE